MHTQRKKDPEIDNQIPGGWFTRLRASIWLFPLILTALLLLLTALKISGSSIGIYNTIFNSNKSVDSSLLLNKPRMIRSDEWVVNTQMTIAQAENNFARVNQNIGHGQDMSVVLDVPYAEWSQAFKPQNWSFFALPLDFAFAFKWWLMAYLLMLSCYFFVLALLPGRRLLAATLSIALLFGALIQWWYQFVTLAPVYYSLFIGAALVHLVRAKRLAHNVLWGVLIAYLLACFALVLYPPFQIACALALAAFGIGYLFQTLRNVPRKVVMGKLGLLVGAVVIASAITLLFVHTRSDVIHAITNTAYPGKRIVASGSFDAAHAFSGHLGFQFQFTGKANHYVISTFGQINQSEASNFILLLPFLLLPSLYIIYQDYRRRRAADWPLIAVNVTFLIFLAWLFIPNLEILGKLLLLDKVPYIRLLLGMGLLNLFQLVLIIRRLQDFRGRLFNKKVILVYAGVVFVIELLLGLYAMDRSPGFLAVYHVLAFSLPVPIILYLLFKKHFTLAAVGFLAFSLFTSMAVNPLYRGSAILTQTPLSQAIKDIAKHDDGIWAAEEIYLENFPIFNGARSLSSVYTYPQLNLWRPVDDGTKEQVYNRYAHVIFDFDRNTATNVKTELVLKGGDNFDVVTEPCSAFMRAQNIRFILTTKRIKDSCVQLQKTVPYLARDYFIYRFKQ